MSMDRQVPAPRPDIGTLSAVELAQLLTQPQVFCSIMHETSLGRFTNISETFSLLPSAVHEYDIRNPNGFLTMIINGIIECSSPIVQFEVIKDDVSDPSLSAFSVFNQLIPNLWTPVRNRGKLRYTNLSSVSTPSVNSYVQILQVRAQIWSAIRDAIGSALKTVGGQLYG